VLGHGLSPQGKIGEEWKEGRVMVSGSTPGLTFFTGTCVCHLRDTHKKKREGGIALLHKHKNKTATLVGLTKTSFRNNGGWGTKTTGSINPNSLVYQERESEQKSQGKGDPVFWVPMIGSLQQTYRLEFGTWW